MSKSKWKIKNKVPVVAANPFAHPRFQQIPLPNIPHLDRIRIVTELGKQAQRDFPNDMQKLHSAILESSPLCLLSMISHHSLVSLDGTNKERKELDLVLQPHVELIQSIILKHSFSEYKMFMVDPGPIVELSKTVFEQYSRLRMANVATLTSDEERQKLGIKEGVRAFTQGVRNWGYPQHIFDNSI